MIPVENEDRRSDWKAELSNRLHDPLQLRIILIGMVLAFGYFAIYMPLSDDIEKTKKAITNENNLSELAVSIEQMEAVCASYEKRLTNEADSKEWMQYILDGIRGFPLKLKKLESLPLRNFGPYKAVAMQIELEGSFFDLDQFLRWLETNPRLLRAEELTIGLRDKPKKGPMHQEGDVELNKDDMLMTLTITGIAG